jgi:hypothetical protein
MSSEKILEVLRKRGCAKLDDLVSSTGYTVFSIMTALNDLLAKGVIRRGEPADPLNPLSTTEWCLHEARAPEVGATLGVIEALVATPPLIQDARGALAVFGAPVLSAQEMIHNAICNATKYFKLAVPYIDRTIYPYLTDPCGKREARFMVLITGQKNKSGLRRSLDILNNIVGYMPNLEYKVVDDERGLHAKFLVVDGVYAAIFTFNLYYTHYVRNYDLGVIVRGTLVKVLDQIFDILWDRAKKPQDG